MRLRHEKFSGHLTQRAERRFDLERPFMILVAVLAAISLPGALTAQNRLSISTSVLDAPGGEVPSGADWRYRVSYSCDLVSIPSCDGAVVTVDLPPEVAFQAAFVPPLDVASAVHDGSPTGGQVTFTFQPSVPAGNTGDLDITVRFPNGSTPDGTTTTNTTDAATSSGTGLVTQITDLGVVRATASPQVDLDAVLQGRWIGDCPSPSTYEVTIGPSSSNGSLNFIDVTQLVLTLPTGVTNVTPNNGGIYSALGNTVTWTALGSVSVPNSITVSVDVSFTDPPFSAGQNVNAFAEATINALGEPPGTPIGPLPFSDTLREFSEDPEVDVQKRLGDGRPNNLPPAEGQDFFYSVRIRNTGNVDLDSLTVVDDGDGAGADLDAALTITSVSTGAYNSGYNSTVTISYTTNMAGPAVLGTSPGGSNAIFAIPALSPGERVTRIEWDFAGPIPAGMSPSTRALVGATVNPGFPAGTTIDNHATASWTATLTGLCGGTPGPAAGSDTNNSNFDVNDPYTYLRTTKNEDTSGPYFPSDTITFSFELENQDLANDPATDPVVVDLLPNFLTFQSGTESFADNGTGVVLAAPSDFEVIDNYNGTGRTLLRWNLTGDLDPGEAVDIAFDVQVEPGVTFGTLTNQVGLTFDDGPTQQICSGSQTFDPADLDGDGDTVDRLCTDSENVTIAAVAQLSSTKSVRGQCDATFQPGLGTGTTLPGGVVDWRVSVQNIQTVPMEDFVIVDILPTIGDTGVRDLTPRLSLFRPLLVAPIAPPPGGAVFYSLSANPCRPEVGGPTAGCDAPNWTPIPPTPITDVQAVKIEFGDRVLAPLDTLEFEWQMVLPADAPTDGSEAFNSFAFGATRQDDGGFLGAEPNKVGIDATCTPTAPDDSTLGDFVWLDSNGNGIQDPAEEGINNIRAELYTPGPDGLARTGDDQLLLSTITADDSMGNPGWYRFSALSAGDYYVLFAPPLGFDVSPQGQGGDPTRDSDADPASACTSVVTLGISEDNPDIDLGLVPRATASLGDYVWFDLNGDGQQNEALDRGLNGTTVRLFADDGDGVPEPLGDDGTPLQVTVTADDDFGNPGHYLFDELIPGVPYFVQFVEPSPATGFTVRDAGGNDTVDSDAATADGTTQVVTLAAGEHNPTLDAGLILLTGDLALGNVVWIDEDGNGVIDAAGDDDGLYDPLVPELGVNGVRLNLYLDISGDSLPQVDEFVATTATQTLAGQTGRYRFTGLPAGDYIVEVDPANFAGGGALQGFISTSFDTTDANDDVDADDSGRPLGTSVVSPPITLSSGSEPTADADDDLENDEDWNFTLDFGFVPGPSPVFDYGDNPDAGLGTAQGDYRTVNFDGGPSHPLLGVAGPYLGACVDADNGQNQNVASTADDLAGAVGPTFGTCAVAGDDEDGVTFSTQLLNIGGTVDLTLTSSSPSPCRINGWIDWNRDGTFDAAEQVLTDEVAGLFPGIAVPMTAVPGFTYARFRCSTAGGDGPNGVAVDGEVEDYRLQITGADWGDAPDVPYATTMGAGGPSHATNPGIPLYLGSCVDTELDGQPNITADGDDTMLGTSRIGDCIDDENGVAFGTMLVRGLSAQVTVTASMAGRLDAWIDFDGVGGFVGPAEQILANVPLAAGQNAFNFTVPANAVTGLTYARFRFSSAGGLAPTGAAADGEVEDYRVLVKGWDYGDQPNTYSTLGSSGGPRHIVDPSSSLYLGSCVDSEIDAGTPLDSTGDDVTVGETAAGSCVGPDDEDGVSLPMLFTCVSSTIPVTANAAGRLDAWIDWDGDGTFTGAGEQIFASQAVSAGTNNLSVSVPCSAALSSATATRWRLSSTGSLAISGDAMDGEVEDHLAVVKGVDFGDAADSHGTTLGNGGPFHGVDPAGPLYLGACVDTETDASGPLDTTGDDTAAGTSTVGSCAATNDDEDGVTFRTMVIACLSTDLNIVTNAGGVLDAWFDFDGDGTFGGANERIFSGHPLATGANIASFTVPCNVAPGDFSARFRLSSTGIATPGGFAMDGEVEDYRVQVKAADLADAPDTYLTTVGAGGPSHGVDPLNPLHFGACVDTEGDGQPNVGATGDDSNAGGAPTGTVGTCSGNDDEDGVVFDSSVRACLTADLTISATGAGMLDAWFDFDGDGTFGGANERIFSGQPLATGANALQFTVPCDASPGSTYARFRYSSTGVATFSGPAMDGEVEDYEVSVLGADRADAPASYGTLEANSGPLHVVDPASQPFYLGACVDTEGDGQPNVGADGDDLTAGSSTQGTCVANDDEDGVTFDTPVTACATATITVTAAAAGRLDAWVDFDADGTFGQPSDQIYASEPLAAGPNVLTFSVPCDAMDDPTYGRFRFSSAGGLSPTGVAVDGEVEDYRIQIDEIDLADAPDSYGTTIASNGPRHGLDNATNLFLGACVDSESDGQPSAAADGDDNGAANATLGTCTGADDEDGVTFDTMLVACRQVDLTVAASTAGLLDAWIDLDGDGTFGQPSDQVFTSQPLAAGSNSISATLPCDAVPGETYARFRISTVGGLTPGGPTSNGEVEDYAVTVKGLDLADAPDSYLTTVGAGGPSHGVDAAAGLFLGACVDTETDGQPSVGADGDDSNAGGGPTGTVGSCASGDDEDGVTFDSIVAACLDADLTVTASNAGLLDAWIDFDGDGTFSGANERVFSGRALAAGGNGLTVAVPCDATTGDSYARFRFSSAGVADFGGESPDGEVEDYQLTVQGVDRADAPDSYGTLEASNGPLHVVDDALQPFFLGSCVDTEADGQPNVGADGDDTAIGGSTQGVCSANDDEDGVTFDTLLTACKPATITVTAAAGGGRLDAWIDFDADGSFAGAGNQIYASEPLTAGPNELTFSVPCDAVDDPTYARFRFSSAGGLTPNGVSMDGEVEDYRLGVNEIDLADAPDSYGTTIANGGPLHGLDPAIDLYLGACVDSEVDGQPSVGADGDDTAAGATTLGTCAASDDEDGVTFDTMLIACQALDLTVVASGSGLLDAWIDLDGDGTFNGANDQIFASQPLVAGSNALSATLHCDVAPGNTYARFRVSTVGALGPGGTTANGEVEDYRVSVKAADLGDAPDGYQTTIGSGGPSHGVDPTAGFHLGTCVDTDRDGQPNTAADGDDSNSGGAPSGVIGTCDGNDDEDGVTFETPVNVCLTADLTVNASAAGVLDAWLDLDGDGTFNGPADRIFSGQALAAGANNLSFTVPCDATPGDSYARFRFTSSGVGSFAGPTMDGEVEDYAVLVQGFDFGDAPDPSYPVLLASDGARHIVRTTGNPVLGTAVDIESDGLQSTSHLGDDLDGLDDEDGVTFSESLLIPGTETSITVAAGAVGGVLNAWLDWNRDGDWNDAGEQFALNLAIGANSSQQLNVFVPIDAVAGQSCARFRFSSESNLAPTGMATDGEVEDHVIDLGVDEPAIGMNKQILEVVDEENGFFLVTYELGFTNFGNVELSEVNAAIDLEHVYADAVSFEVVSTTSADLVENPAFDGSTDLLVLSAGNVLPIGGSGSVEIAVRVHPGFFAGPYVCSTVGFGTSPDDEIVEDESQDGDDPDVDDDGDAEDDDEPTPVEFPIDITEIPVGGPLGLTLLAALLSALGWWRLRR